MSCIPTIDLRAILMSSNELSLLSKQTIAKRDRRTHDERITDLEAAFAILKTKAISSGIKTDASAAKVLKDARVNRTYFYVKDKLKDKLASAKYQEVRIAIQNFQDNFDSFCSDTLVNQLRNKLSQAEEQRNQIATTMIEQQKLVAEYQNHNSILKKKARIQSNQIVDVLHSTGVNLNSKVGIFGDVRIISLDTYLWKNGKYMFDDEIIRQEAWKRATKELTQVLQRALPMRIYILIGAPCAGKTFWSKDHSNFYPDLHSVIIDATNLTLLSRLKWISHINKYRTKDTRICAVVFDTPKSVLQSRNNRREPTKQVRSAQIFKKANELEIPNLLHEDIDEMIIVRSLDE